jgi:hypothetical protein
MIRNRVVAALAGTDSWAGSTAQIRLKTSE